MPHGYLVVFWELFDLVFFPGGLGSLDTDWWVVLGPGGFVLSRRVGTPRHLDWWA